MQTGHRIPWSLALICLDLAYNLHFQPVQYMIWYTTSDIYIYSPLNAEAKGYDIIKPLYPINDNDNSPILSVFQPITQRALMPCLSGNINNIPEPPPPPWKYTNIPQRNINYNEIIIMIQSI